MDAHLKAPEPAHLEVPVCLYSQSARSSTVFTDAVSILSIEKAEKEETPVSEEDLCLSIPVLFNESALRNFASVYLSDPDGGKEAYIVLFATFVCNFLGTSSVSVVSLPLLTSTQGLGPIFVGWLTKQRDVKAHFTYRPRVFS